ncbi:MAG: cytochrome d ubiquinol oxidase subunit II [Bacteroidota bacterium]
MDYNLVWFILIGILLIGYAILDGFDLGVGALHLFTKSDRDRRIMLNSIGPVWDGNEVWLITAGGALFAAFPDVYATAFSGFYLPFMLLLVGLIFRAVSIEFRSKEENPIWRRTWDIAFGVSSIVIAILFGVAIGNVVVGFEIGPDKEYYGSFLDLISPYTLAAGVFNLTMFTMHGALYLMLKTEGELRKRLRRLAFVFWGAFNIMYALLTAYTIYIRPQMLANFSFGLMEPLGTPHPIVTEHQILISVIAWTVVLLNILSILAIPMWLWKKKYLNAFVASALTIAAIIFFFALGLFPNMMVANDPANSLDIYNAASSEYTLRTMFILACIGLPFVLGYTTIIYWTYRGKTILDEQSY